MIRVDRRFFEFGCAFSTLKQVWPKCPHKKYMSSIRVYQGKGSKKESRDVFLRSLKETVDLSVHNVEYITADDVKEGSWMSQTKVICLGGGYDLGYIESLGSVGVRNIRDFVNGGGSYLGICAGAYFACDYIEFDMNGPLEVVGERKLKFYEGKCIGPAFPGFDYNSRRGVHAVPVTYQNMEVEAYSEGGGYFSCYNPLTYGDHTVLGRYKTLDTFPAAIVKCRYGLGTAMLSGVHIEYPVRCLNVEDQYIQKVLQHFIRAEGRRKFVFRDMLCNHLDITCCDIEYPNSYL